ncbi:hypothetical protein NL676_016378 [Syzygium grande]|nr:hypothetical protein NL676_016378 [Syzygium grande]
MVSDTSKKKAAAAVKRGGKATAAASSAAVKPLSRPSSLPPSHNPSQANYSWSRSSKVGPAMPSTPPPSITRAHKLASLS